MKEAKIRSAPPNGRADPAPRHLGPTRSAGLDRRKALWVGVVVASAVVGAVALRSGGGATTPVLAAAHALAPGDTVRASDLTVIDLKATGGAATIPATRRSAIVGEQVTGPMAAGTLLSPSSVAPGPQLAPGEVGVALALDPDRAAQGILAVGQSVLIMGQSGAVPLSVPARVLGITPGSSTSPKVVVDLALTSRADAGAVAASAVTPAGLRLVVVPRG